MSGKALHAGLWNSLFCGLFVILIGFSPLRAQITEYSVTFNGLNGIAAGPDGNMWFSGNRNIGRITTAGVVTAYPVPTSNDASGGIAAGPDGAMWFTESPLNSPASNGGWFAKIGRITTSGVITEYPLPDPMSIPTAITAGPDGALWFIESGNGKIGRISTSGTITEFPLPASEVNYGVDGITSGPDGNLWFTQGYAANKILRMTTSGVFTIYTVATFVSAGSLALTAGPDGALWFTDQASKIGRITTSGTITEYALPANDSPFAIAAGPDGALWFTDSLGQIERITTSGTVTSQVATPTNTAGGFLGYIAAGPDGAMWFTEVGGKIGRIPTGVTVTPPTITEVANAEGESPTIAPNTWVLIKGSNLAKAGDSRTWLGSDFVNDQMPTQLDGVSVTVNGKPAFVYYISPAQLNILTPPDAISGSVQIQVANNGATSANFTAQAQAESTSFFVFNGGPYIAAVHLNGSLIGPATLFAGYTSPAQPGETIVIYANGFGPTSAQVVSGSSTQSGTLSPLPVLTIGGIGATVTFAGLVAPGEFQFNAIVPSSLANGDQPVTATYNGLTTQSGTLLTVHQ
ncbi:MAG: IPT/TIG domain-containing protein [Acidobacteriia bacterium]|nr:IPT/TIG domain-containing protein [Terriglobia bacterium]